MNKDLVAERRAAFEQNVAEWITEARPFLVDARAAYIDAVMNYNTGQGTKAECDMFVEEFLQLLVDLMDAVEQSAAEGPICAAYRAAFEVR